MAFEFKFPDVGEGITEGTIVKWKVKVGDKVKNDQPIAEIETDKAIVDIPSPRAGVISKIRHKVGDVIKVGEVLVVIDDGSSAAKPKKQERYTGSVIGVVDDKVVDISNRGKSGPHKKENAQIRATLKVRRLAKKMSVDLSKVAGSGPGGRITEEDLKRSGTVELKGLRKAVARNMELSAQKTVPVTNFYDLDVTKLWETRSREKVAAEKKGVKLTFLPYIMKACAKVLAKHPMITAQLQEQKLVMRNEHDYGFAVDTPDGLIVPVIRDVDKKTLLEIAKELEELSVKARERRLTLEQMKGSTFSITNLGSIGVKYFTPVINYPESAILGLGRIEDAAIVVKGKVAVRKVMPLSLTYDHKVIDGATASRFMLDLMKELTS